MRSIMLGNLNQVPKPPPPTNLKPASTSIDITHPRVSAFMNVLVFTPYAFYMARGKKPPTWLVAASLAWLGIQFASDLTYLVRGDTSNGNGLQGCGCQQPMTTTQDAFRYRVNR